MVFKLPELNILICAACVEAIVQISSELFTFLYLMGSAVVLL